MAAVVIAGLLLALCILPSTGDKPSASWDAIYLSAQTQLDNGQLDKAWQLSGNAYAQWRNNRQSPWHWQFRLLLAESLLELGNPEQAGPLLNGPPAPPAFEGRRLADLGWLQYWKHDYAAAMTSLAGAEAFEETPYLRARIDLTRGMANVKQGKLPAAEENFRRALAGLGASRPLHEALALNNLGLVYLNEFRYDEAVLWLGRARDKARQTGSQRAEALALGNLGVAYLWLGDVDRSLQLFREAAAIEERRGNTVMRQRLLALTGEAYESLGAFPQAAEYFHKAWDLGPPDDAWLCNILVDLTNVALESGDIPAAEQQNAKAMAVAQLLKLQRFMVLPLLNAGRIAMARKRNAEAETDFRAAIEINREGSDPISLWQSHSGLAALYRSSNRMEEAGQEYRAAIKVIEGERTRIGKDELKMSFLSNLSRFYQNYVDFLYETGRTREAFEMATSSRARVLAEYLRRPDADGPGAARPLERLSGKQRLLLMSYWIAPGRSFLWVVDAAGLHAYVLPGKAEIDQRVERWRKSIAQDENPLETEAAAGRWLFAKLVAEHYTVPAGSHVVIVPDGSLHELNFETLPGPSGEYWIRDVTIAVTPSLALLRPAESRPAPRLLLIGDPVYQSGEFQRLRHLNAEMKAVSSHFAERSVYESAAATPDAYRQAAVGAYSTLHFAAHAIANPDNPLDSAIVLSGERGQQKLYAREILAPHLHLQAELVTLSACETAGKKTYSGEGLTGFAWAFLSAGARNVVAGLWDVDDRATSELMAHFYDARGAGEAPPAALRSAKLKLMSSSRVYQKPIYWAAFETFTRAMDAPPR